MTSWIRSLSLLDRSLQKRARTRLIHNYPEISVLCSLSGVATRLCHTASFAYRTSRIGQYSRSDLAIVAASRTLGSSFTDAGVFWCPCDQRMTKRMTTSESNHNSNFAFAFRSWDYDLAHTNREPWLIFAAHAARVWTHIRTYVCTRGRTLVRSSRAPLPDPTPTVLEVRQPLKPGQIQDPAPVIDDIGRQDGPHFPGGCRQLEPRRLNLGGLGGRRPRSESAFRSVRRVSHVKLRHMCPKRV